MNPPDLVVGLSPGRQQVVAAGQAPLLEPAPIGRQRRERVRLVHDPADGDAHGRFPRGSGQARSSRTTRGLAVDQRAVAAGPSEDERRGVEAEEVQERRVVVGVGHDVLDGLVAELVGRAVDVARP